jgi:hypothetical protein
MNKQAHTNGITPPKLDANNEENRMPKPNLREVTQSRPLEHGEVVTLPLQRFGLASHHSFYRIDEGTARLINQLARQKFFPAWKQLDTKFWVQPKSGKLYVSETSGGWLAQRQLKGVEATLTHQLYMLPILFPDSTMARFAAELCFPKPHPALHWGEQAEETIEDGHLGAYAAMGWIGWSQLLPEHTWLLLMRAAA